MPTVSLITINRNNDKGLRKTIKSVASQSFTDFEYILIDGGSTDESIDIIKEYANKISYWISEPDNGIYHAMNKGIRQAKGEFIQFLNSGDWLASDAVLGKVFLDLPDCDMVYGNMIKTMQGGKLVTDKGPAGNPVSFQTFYSKNINHSSVFIRAALFAKYGLYDEQLKIVSDWKFFLIAAGLNKCRIVYKDVDVVYFDMTGISNSQRDLGMAERKKVLEELVPYPILEDYKNNEADGIRLALINRHFFTARLYRLTQILLVRISNLLTRPK
jgi:glycosyltransferase involved in cell wall biosynthesis